MSEPLLLHPSELAYVFSYMRVGGIVGWGSALFTPPPGGADAFYRDGLARLRRAGRVLPGKQPGRFRIDEAVSRIAATLSEPQIVLVAQRRDGDGVRLLTEHVAGAHVVEMSMRADGRFAVLEQPSLAAAAGAAAGFVGASEQPAGPLVRLEATQEILARMKKLAAQGRAAAALPALVKLGAVEESARSALAALGRPEASGVASVMYCTGNSVVSSETYSVLTAPNGASWMIYAPGAPDGPVVLERTSIGGLSARILVGITARIVLPA